MLAKQNMKKHYESRKKNQRFSTIELNEVDRVLLRVRHLSNALDRVTKNSFICMKGPIKFLKS